MSFTPASSHTPTTTALTTPHPPTSHRWLKSHELLSLLTHPNTYNLHFTPHPPLLPPPPGTLLLYNKSTCRRWRLDHRVWRMPERHVKLKVKGVERMNAIYAQEQSQAGRVGGGGGGMCRRGYWLLDRKDVVLVHYVSKEGGGGEGVGEVEWEGAVKEEGMADERKEWTDVEVTMKDAPQWLPPSHDEETKEPPPPPPHPLSPPPLTHTLSVNPPTDTSFLSLSTTLLSPTFTPSASAMQLPPLPSDELLSPSSGGGAASSSPVVLDVAPCWDYACGGGKLLVCCSCGHLFDPRALRCLFDQQALRVHPITTGVYRVIVPPLPQQQAAEAGGRAVSVSVVLTDGRVSTPAVEFEYRPMAASAATSVATTHSHPSFPLPTLTQSPPLPSRTSSLSHMPPSLSACSTPRQSSVNHSSSWRATLPAGRELLSSLLSLLMSIERHLLLSSAAATCSFLSTFTLEDIQRLVQSHPSDDLLEGMLLNILHSLAPTATHSTASSTLHSPTHAATPTTTYPPPTTTTTLHRLLSLSDHSGRQLIHLCASLGYLHLLAFLLDTGISIHTPTTTTAALTPLHLAVMGGEEEVVRAVLAMGGEEARVDGLGRSAVELARRLDKQRLVAVFREVQEEEERESGWQWEEAEEDDDEDGTTLGGGTIEFEHSQHQQPFLSLSTAFAVPPSLPLSPSASLSPLSSYLSVSTIPPPLMAAGSTTTAPPSSTLSDVALSSSFSRLTLSDIGIDTSELSLHLQSLHPQPASFASFVSHTLTHVRSWLYRRHYAALTLQAAARGMLVRRRQKRLRESAVVIQQAVRRRKERRESGGSVGGGRFHHLVQDMQERVRRKREEMEREGAGGGDGGEVDGKEDGLVGGGGDGDGMDLTGSRIVSPTLEGFGGVGGVGAAEHLLPLSPLASSTM